MPVPVVFSYTDLANQDADVSDLLEEAFGPAGLGICTVSGVPGISELRQQLLPLALQFAGLPEGVRQRYEDPASRFNFGWSCGRETLEGGRPDTGKGSFYANPLLDVPTTDPDLLRTYPSYCRPNLWPRGELPQLEAAFKALGGLIIHVGLLLTRHCDTYLASRGHPPRLAAILEQSPCHKGRLLHYFAPAAAGAGDSAQNWCGWHYDNGSLTGLTSAMYLDAAGQSATCPDLQAGLHIRDRSGQVVQAAIPADHLGFQVGEGHLGFQASQPEECLGQRAACLPTSWGQSPSAQLIANQPTPPPLQAGEAMQIHSGGLLRGTQHCVVAPRPELSMGISRSTFAVFMQPKWSCPLDAPAGVSAQDVGIGQWRPGVNFGQHSEATFDAYYKQAGTD